MMKSLDGYIAGPDGDIGLPVPEGELHRHFNDMMRQTSIALCGRRMYEEMRFWDSPERETSASEVKREFARAWKETPKIVCGRGWLHRPFASLFDAFQFQNWTNIPRFLSV